LIIKNYKYHILKSKSDLYIIAIGTNDVRYRDPEICAMTKEEYIENIKNIVKFAKFNNKNSNFIFIFPWLSEILKNIDNNKYNSLFHLNYLKILKFYHYFIYKK
jgi:lysophospholipase L1-like esterase